MNRLDKTQSERIDDGLFIETNRSGASYWVLRYKHAGKWHKMGLGPARPSPNQQQSGVVSTEEAKAIAAHARQLIRNGIDPMADRMSISGLPPSVKRGIVAREATKKWAAVVTAAQKGKGENGHAGSTAGDPDPATPCIADDSLGVNKEIPPACATTIARCAEHIGWLHRLAVERGMPQATEIANDITRLVYSISEAMSDAQ